jgi:signal transduction histidine kinase
VHLVEDLGRLARAEAAGAVLHRENVVLQQAISQLLALERSNLEAKRLTVEADIPPDLEVSADRDKLLQALRNLLENAWKYTPAGGRVEVAAKREEETVRIVFENSGPGIPQQDLPFVFERFYRGDPSRSRAAGGAGIGLAIVKEIVRAHGGRVGAESEAGRTRVWLELPVAA